MKIQSTMIEIFTDGSCLNNPWNGWWAYILKYKDIEKQDYAWVKDTTNNQMELLAVINALKALKENAQNIQINLYTDSNYVKMWITQWINKWKQNNWKTANKKDVKNKELWEELDNLASNFIINWHWVKAHATNKYNNIVDELARKWAYSIS